MQAQFCLLLPDYTDACGTPFYAPVLATAFQLTPPPAAALSINLPGTIDGDAGQATATLTLVYSNCSSTQVTITDLFPARTNLIATNLTSGGLSNSGSNLTWTITLNGSGTWTGFFDVLLTSGAPCQVPSGIFANRLLAQGTNCHGFALPISGTNTTLYFSFANGASCYTNGGEGGPDTCRFSATAYGPSLVEACEPAQLYAVFTNFSGSALPTNWNSVVFQSDLANGLGKLASTNTVTVEVNGIDRTAFATVLQTSPVFRLSLSNLTSAIPKPTSNDVVTIGWQVTTTNRGALADSSSLTLPSCQGSAHWFWNAGGSDMRVVLHPIVNYYGCMPADVRIDLSNLPGPNEGAGTTGTFPAYDVKVVLDLDADNDLAATYSYFPGSTVFTNLIAWGGGYLTNSEPVLNDHTLTWSLGPLATNGAGSILLRLISGCSQTANDYVQAHVGYNDLCHAGTLPPSTWAESEEIPVLPLQTGSLKTYLDPELQPLVSSNVQFTIHVQNTGPGPAMNATTEFIFPSNLIFISASVIPSSISPTNAIWSFHQLNLTNAPGDLTSYDASIDSTRGDDLPPNGAYAITVTVATVSCGDKSVLARSWSGCSPTICQTSPDVSAAFATVNGAVVSSATFPAEATICITNTARMRIRNASIANAYHVETRLAVPQNGIVVTGSYRYVYNDTTNIATSSAGRGTEADPLIFTGAGVLPLDVLPPAAELDILCDVYLPCSVSAGTKTLVTSSRLTDACGLITEMPAVNSTVYVKQPVLNLSLAASLDNTNFTTGSLLVKPGMNIYYKLSFHHDPASQGDVAALQLGAMIPDMVDYQGASLPPDTQAGGSLTWHPATIAPLLPSGLFTNHSAPISIIITGQVIGCIRSDYIYTTALLEYGCNSNQLCLSASASQHPVTTRPVFHGPATAASLALTSCGGSKTATYRNANGDATNIVVVDTAPAGYVFDNDVIVQEAYTNEPLTVALSGSPAGSTISVSFSNAAPLSLNQQFTLVYTHCTATAPRSTMLPTRRI
jgi:uncharacterized repeat protein (TIGR01451 family)